MPLQAISFVLIYPRLQISVTETGILSCLYSQKPEEREKDHKVQASLGYIGKSSSENTKQIKKLSFNSIPSAISL